MGRRVRAGRHARVRPVTCGNLLYYDRITHPFHGATASLPGVPMPSVVLTLVVACLAQLFAPLSTLEGQRTPREQLAHGRRLLEIPLRRLEAERAFRQAFDGAVRLHDTVTLVDAARELGEIRRRRWLTGRDRRLYTSGIVFDPIAAARRLHYTREFLEQHSRPVPDVGTVDRLDAERWFRRALDARPTDAGTLLPLLDLLADAGRHEEMRALTARAIAAGDTTPRLRMVAGLAAVRLGRMADAAQHFERAIALFDETTRSELTDVGRLLRLGDSARVAGLSDDARRGTTAAFWEAADPLLDTPVNEARLEYLARMAYADLHFRVSDSTPPGWHTDRGSILVRYGPPPVIATFAPRSEADLRDAIGRVITVWFYPSGEMDFVFTGPPAFNAATFAGDYREMSGVHREASPFLIDNVPLARDVDSLPTQLARFRGRTPDELDLVVASALPLPAFYEQSGIDRSQLEITVRAGMAGQLQLAARDSLPIVLPGVRPTTRYWSIPLRDQPTTTGRQQLSSDAPLRVRIEAVDPALADATARSQHEFAPLRRDSSFTISDVLLVEPSRRTAWANDSRRWQQQGLVPRGTLRLAPYDTVGLYWELYHLATAPDGRRRYDVEIRVTLLEIDRGRDPIRRAFGGLADLVGLSAEGDQQLGLRFRREEPVRPGDRIPEMVTIGLGSAPAGTYRLDLTVTDVASGVRTTTSRTLSVSSTSP